MLGVASSALDLSALLQFACTVLAFIGGALILIRKAASRYFVVDASFEAPEEFKAPSHMPISGGCDAEGVGATECATCGRSTVKKCSRCKSVWYCSETCQMMHWEADHKSKCRKAERSSDKFDVDKADARRKSTTISLVPDRGTCKVLKEPKKILFPYDEFVKLFDWDKPAFPPCGLLNCGNSCFANVVLQCLACTRPLVAYLLEKGHARGCLRRRDDWCFLCELQVHIKRASESSQPFSPINILSRLPNIGGNLGYGRQEDAHEFMRFAIDTMQSICLDEYGGEKAVDPSTQATTIVQYIFGGHLQSQVICTNCPAVSKRYENMMDLTVEIQGGSESLEECLEQFTMEEWLDGENMYKCDECNDYVKACKRLTVHQAPNVLTIALKRFQSGRFGKLNKRVTFPEKLNLTPYMSTSGDGSDHYELYGVVVHLDMLNASFFGHYICYIKDYRGIWYRIDDCKVIKVEVEEVLAQGAYMLLYHRNKPRKDPFVKPVDSISKKEVVEIEGKASITQDSTKASTSITSSQPMDACTQTDVQHSESSEVGPTLRDTGHDRQLDEEELDHEDPMDVDAPITMTTDPVPSFSADSSIHGSFSGPSIANGNQSSQPSEASSPFNISSAEIEASATNSHVAEANGSDDVQPISCPVMEEASTAPIECANGGVCASVEFKMANGTQADGSTNKLKPIFARGFLDKPIQKKPAGQAKTFQMVNKAPNCYSNGHLNRPSTIEIANTDGEKLDTPYENGDIATTQSSRTSSSRKVDCNGV